MDNHLQKQLEELPEWLTDYELSLLTGKTFTTHWRERKKGRLPYTKFSFGIRYSHADVVTFLTRCGKISEVA